MASNVDRTNDSTDSELLLQLHKARLIECVAREKLACEKSPSHLTRRRRVLAGWLVLKQHSDGPQTNAQSDASSSCRPAGGQAHQPILTDRNGRPLGHAIHQAMRISRAYLWEGREFSNSVIARVVTRQSIIHSRTSSIFAAGATSHPSSCSSDKVSDSEEFSSHGLRRSRLAISAPNLQLPVLMVTRF